MNTFCNKQLITIILSDYFDVFLDEVIGDIVQKRKSLLEQSRL